MAPTAAAALPNASATTLDRAAARRAVAAFVRTCGTGTEYRLTRATEPTPYARCFAIYCLHLCNADIEPAEREALARAVRSSVREARTSAGARAPVDKPYRQLLAFSLSALAALGVLDADPLEDLVTEQIPADVGAELASLGSLEGRPGSGNQAMFVAVFLLHARDVLRLETGRAIDDWVGLHLARMNRFGFWSRDGGMTHLLFQNGYHQYEILEYLGVPNPRARDAAEAVGSIADPQGHFAPYPGGGSCYDYDAVFVLTPAGHPASPQVAALLERTAATIAGEQRPDGGFAESLSVRPRSLATFSRFAAHIARGAFTPALALERLRYGLTLQRPAHDRIHTHWSRQPRRWDESNLWDSWFRLLTLARIQTALDPAAAADWGFIDCPGIGHHPSVGRPRRGA